MSSELNGDVEERISKESCFSLDFNLIVEIETDQSGKNECKNKVQRFYKYYIKKKKRQILSSH